MSLIPRSFYSRNTVSVARDLLGKTLVRKMGRTVISGIISETEAYGYKDDPASHSYGGQTERNKAMFGEVGKAYVYFTYGMHFCVNAVARDGDSEAGAVLIRALIPKSGIEYMVKSRKTDDVSNLTSGPGKLTQALGITRAQYGEDMTRMSGLYITDGLVITKSMIEVGPRIGIRKATGNPWNFKIGKRFFKS